MAIYHCRARRRFVRGLKRKPMAFMKRLRKAKKEAPALEKPAVSEICVADFDQNIFISYLYLFPIVLSLLLHIPHLYAVHFCQAINYLIRRIICFII